MEFTLLYSGGKDSSPVALLLDASYDVTLVAAYFGVMKDWTHVRDAAAELGYAFETLEPDREVAAAATTRMVEGGYPHGGIRYVREHALEAACGFDFDAVADGTHRDDRVPLISRVQAQSLGDRHGVDYLSSLSGFGRGMVGRLVELHLDVETGPSEEVPKVDYEDELRHLAAVEHGQAAVDEVFPDHIQSYVHSRR